jgi:poly-gamma-glutamate capsule biosynthesis protein CapA/YwtB (metallophosphatase superfamily)
MLKIIYTALSLLLIPLQDFAQTGSFKEPEINITISAVGDLMCHALQYNYAEMENGKFDFDPAFKAVKKYFENSDFVFGNLETVTAGKSRGFSTYPLFNSPDEYLTALKNAGFSLLTTANNHALDQGKKGVLRTIGQLEKNHLNYTGTFKSERDRDSIRIFNIKGIKTAFLAYSYGTNGIPVPKDCPYLINLIDMSLIRNDIKAARKKGAEIVLVYFHFGYQYSKTPNDFQKQIVNETINAGADIIIGGHPHVLQPVRYFKTKGAKLDSGFIAYSMGNFFTNQRDRYTDAGMILNINITKNFSNDSIYISNVSYTPTWVFRGDIPTGKKYTVEKKEFLILPSEEALNNSSYKFLTSNDLFKIGQSIGDTKKILNRYTHRIKLYDYDKDIIHKIKELAVPRNLARPRIFWSFSRDKMSIFSLIYHSR